MEEIDFRGKTKDYFGIWLSNLLLTLITLGIFSAWAKVRRIKYFYNNTEILGHSFGYHATGGQILVGRLIAIAILAIFSAISNQLPLEGQLVSPLAIFFLIPWLLNRSLNFRARMISYRNIRFRWHGTYWRTLLFFILGSFLSIISIGLLLPLISRNYYRYYATYHSFGTSRFTTETKIGDYYKAFFVNALAPALLLTCIFTLLVSGLGLIANNIVGDGVIPRIGLPFLPFTILIFIFVLPIIYGILCRNLMVASLVLGNDAAFGSELKPLWVVWISVSNLLAIIFSLGLLYPWAQIRLYRYLANKTSLEVTGDIDKFVDENTKSIGALGEEYSSLEDIDVSI